MKKTFLISILSLFLLSACNSQPKQNQVPTDLAQSQITEAEARTIAEASCIKGGEALSPGIYFEDSKTWSFIANLNATKPRCSSKCVVSEETKTAEIKWECGGDESENKTNLENKPLDKRVELNAGNNPWNGQDPTQIFVASKLCNLVEFNDLPPDQNIHYENSDWSIAFEIPFNENWGDENFKLTTYNQVATNPFDTLEFGPILNLGGEGCNWMRPYHLVFEPVVSPEEFIKRLKNDENHLFVIEPTIIKINNLTAVKYSTRGVNIYPTFEVIGKKYNYKFYIDSTDPEKDFKILEDIVKTIKLL